MPREIDIVGWNAPLDIEWDVAVDTLRREIRNAAPFDSGALRSAFDSPETVIWDEKEKTINVSVLPPARAAEYAKIQDTGGRIPPFDIRNPSPRQLANRHGKPYKKVMVAHIGGTTRFFTKRRGFVLRGSEYVYKGVVAWLRQIGRGKTLVRWRGGKAGSRFGVVTGRVSR